MGNTITSGSRFYVCLVDFSNCFERYREVKRVRAQIDALHGWRNSRFRAMQMKILCCGRRIGKVCTPSTIPRALAALNAAEMGPTPDENEAGACVLTQPCWHCISPGIIIRVSIIVSIVIGFDVTSRPIGYLNSTESRARHPMKDGFASIPSNKLLRFVAVNWGFAISLNNHAERQNYTRPLWATILITRNF